MSESISSSDLVRRLWLAQGLPEEAIKFLDLRGDAKRVIPSSFKLGIVAQASIALAALSAAYFSHLRGNKMRRVSVDARHAILEYKSEDWHLINDHAPEGSLWDPLTGLYRTKDDAYVRLHTNFPHHRRGILDILGCEGDREAVQAKLLEWNSEEFETVASERGMCATALRTFEQWDQHPQARTYGEQPVLVEKFDDADLPGTTPGKNGILNGIRILDLTRVIAGPPTAYGATVLRITSPKLPSLPYLDSDTSRGKRSTQLDLTQDSDRNTLRDLAKDCDVFLQAYRPGGLAAKGFVADDVVAIHPGAIYAELRAYGWNGPWKDRRGFDSLVQTAIGFNDAEGKAYHAAHPDDESAAKPRPFPVQALDHTAGYLLAFGINAALCKRLKEGGSWHVRVSLAGVGSWIRSLGQIDPKEAFASDIPSLPARANPPAEEIERLLVKYTLEDENGSSGQGHMHGLSHAAQFQDTQESRRVAPSRLDADKAHWF